MTALPNDTIAETGNGAPSYLLASLRTELLKLRKRPAIWILTGLTVFNLVFVQYLLQYGYYLGEKRTNAVLTFPLAFQIQGLLPIQSIQNVMQTTRDVGIAGMLILGALTLGSEYGWGTVKTTLAQGPPRRVIYLSQVIAVALILVLLVVVLFLAAAGSGAIIASIEPGSYRLPPAADLIEGAAATYLILALPAAMGLMLAALMRSSAFAIGLGLGWIFVVETTVEQLAFSLPLFSRVVAGLPGVNADALSTVFGAVNSSQPAIYVSPTAGSGLQFALIVSAYTIAFIALGALVFHRRDVT